MSESGISCLDGAFQYKDLSGFCAANRLAHFNATVPTGLLEAGDPKGQVRMAWHAKESVGELYTHTDAEVALTFVDELVADMADKVLGDRRVARP
jgi:hypothetical protein